MRRIFYIHQLERPESAVANARHVSALGFAAWLASVAQAQPAGRARPAGERLSVMIFG